ncbi:hypothetical protein B0H19DRAFT_478857 [Mycena capillaripes]|nr:hypothetical protein B0H19DRAFT_478857 [Mycena capillaripes]
MHGAVDFVVVLSAAGGHLEFKKLAVSLRKRGPNVRRRRSHGGSTLGVVMSCDTDRSADFNLHQPVHLQAVVVDSPHPRTLSLRSWLNPTIPASSQHATK